nr:DNA helicase [Tanacetum cinerariifolium]
MMIDGSCGAVNMSATSIQGDKCTKSFPKKFTSKTFFDDKVHVHYQRRDTGLSTIKHQISLDNSYVVPYNRDLLLAFDAHINVKYCGWSPSRPSIDKIQNYLKGRFICPHEAIWRILEFDIHHREPVIQILSVHLEDMQRITFRDRDRLESIINLPSRKNTTLTEWFAYNAANEDGRHLTYLDFPLEFVWYDDRKSWWVHWNSKASIGRLAYMHPTSGELFYFRMFLCYQKGCREFREVQTVHEIFYPTCRAACKASENMRLSRPDVSADECSLITSFASWLLDIRDGKTGEADQQDPENTSWIDIPLAYCLPDNEQGPSRPSIDEIQNYLEGHFDETPMNDRHCFEALDRTLRDILTMPYHLFGGKSVVIGGDFRKTLLVKKDNMRLSRPDVGLDERSLITSFASWLLDIGDGKTGEADKQDPENTAWIDIPLSYYLLDNEQGLSNLIDFIYDENTLKTPFAITLQHKAIVCLKNQTADMINSKVLEMVQGEMTTYLSHDEETPFERDGAETEMLYPVEQLTTLKFPSFPPHRLELKVGAPVMLLRNVNVVGGL